MRRRRRRSCFSPNFHLRRCLTMAQTPSSGTLSWLSLRLWLISLSLSLRQAHTVLAGLVIACGLSYVTLTEGAFMGTSEENVRRSVSPSTSPQSHDVSPTGEWLPW